jgi:hypothetical protein
MKSPGAQTPGGFIVLENTDMLTIHQFRLLIKNLIAR